MALKTAPAFVPVACPGCGATLMSRAGDEFVFHWSRQQHVVASGVVSVRCRRLIELPGGDARRCNTTWRPE